MELGLLYKAARCVLGKETGKSYFDHLTLSGRDKKAVLERWKGGTQSEQQVNQGEASPPVPALVIGDKLLGVPPGVF